MHTNLPKTQTLGEVPLTDVDHKHRGVVKEFFAKLSRGLMLPISMLPIAGIMIGIGSILTDSSMIPVGAINIFGQFLSIPGKLIFSCLPMLFAISICVTFTKDSGPAGVCALLA
jgi:PTS system glucose-specific IIC component